MRTRIQDSLSAITHALWYSVPLFFRNGLTNHAAATALYALLSAAPLLILLTWAMQSLSAWAPNSVSAQVLLSAFYQQFQLETLAELGVIPAQRHLSTSGIGLLTLLLSSRGMLNSIQGAMGVIFLGEAQRHPVLAWIIPLLIVPLAVLLLGTTLVTDQILTYLLDNNYLSADKGALLGTLNHTLMLVIGYLFIFAIYHRLPANRPPWRQTAAFSALSLLSLVILFSSLSYFLQLNRFQLIYGAIGGVVFILMATFAAAMLLYFWAQFLRVYSDVDVRAFERLIVADTQAQTEKLGSVPEFGRLVHRYGRELAIGETLIREGDQSDKSAFFICSGRLRLTRQVNAKARSLAELKSGDLFGEMAYLLDEPRTATATATETTVVLALPPQMLESLLRQSPRAARDIIHTLCIRLKRMNEASSD